MKRCSFGSSVEYTAVHFECYQIFIRVCDFGKLQCCSPNRASKRVFVLVGYGI
ncbi:hypothetical protein V8C34DRAFT_288603 [Trichoderma compactum]